MTQLRADTPAALEAARTLTTNLATAYLEAPERSPRRRELYEELQAALIAERRILERLTATPPDYGAAT